MTDPRLLCRVDPSLVGHVEQLLADAGLSSTRVPQPDGTVSISVAAADDEHARSVIGLVLPQLLVDPEPGEPPGPGGPLSDRLIRTEAPGLPGGLIDASRTFGYADPLADHPDDDSEFVPPPPPPLPRPRDRIAKAAWFAVLGGPVLLLLVAVFSLPGILSTVGLILFFGGFATLVWRTEERNRHDDGWDDGAVV